jgi:hypothetical protein
VRECGVLTPQKGGTLAGPDVAFGEFYDAAMKSRYRGSGFMYLYDVERGPAGDRFALDWPVVDTFGLRQADAGQVHLRWTMLEPDGELVLAHGDPPFLRQKKPRRLRYGLVFRRGEDLRSTFVSVIEPYLEKRNVLGCERLEVSGEDGGGVAVKVELPDGRVDYIVFAAGEGTEYKAGQGLVWNCAFGFVRTQMGRAAEMRMVRGTVLGWRGAVMEAPVAAYKGTVAGVEIGPTGENLILVDCELPLDGSLRGKELHVSTRNERNGTFPIAGVSREGDEFAVSVGEKSLVCGYLDPAEPERGRRMIVAEGDSFEIPTVVSLTRRSQGE